MTRCERCQPLILDHLYGLLEGSEAAAVEAHLRECPACAAARDQAARVQGLFAKAAKGAFPAVRFDAPQAKPEKSSKAPMLAMPASPASTRPGAGKFSRVAIWLPWAVAAAVLLAIPGTVIPVLGTLKRAESARKNADTALTNFASVLGTAEKADWAAKEPRAAAQRDLAAKKQYHDMTLAKWMGEEKAVLAARKTSVDVLKPASPQPGAPNEFLLVVRDSGSTPRSRLLAEIRDQTDAVIVSQRLDPEHGGPQHPLRLPADAWTKLTPQSELFLVVSSVDDKTGTKTAIQEPIKLFGPIFATMLVTDKPAYRPGETVYFRSLTLDRTTFRPPVHEQRLEYALMEVHGTNRSPLAGKVMNGGTDLVRVTDGKASPVLGPDGKPIRGVGCGAFALPPDLPDGDYTLMLNELPHPAGYPAAVPVPVTRPIKVRAGTVDTYQKMTGYTAASYAPGETVEAWAALKLKNEPVAGAEVRAFALADGMELEGIAVQPPVTGPDGRVNLRFTLPPELKRDDVRLKVFFKTKDGKNVVEESVANRVPLVGRHLIVEFFPEGGELVGGVPCRVYFRATTPAGQPVDIRGTITDGRQTLAKVETLTDVAQGVNRGIGSFTFTPTLNTPVWLKLESPAGMYAPLLVPDEQRFPLASAAAGSIPAVVAANTGFLLPQPKKDGVVMTIPNPVTTPGQPIRVQLRSVAQVRNLVVGAYVRGRLADSPKRVTVEPDNVVEVSLMAGIDPRGGVVRITVFEEPDDAEARGDAKPEGKVEGKVDVKPDLKPLAERLVFRKPGESLKLDFNTTGARVAAGADVFATNSTVDLNITATDEKGNPAAAILYAAAVNTGVAPGPKDRLLTTHFLIAGEINSPDAMEYADFLLTDHPKAAEVLDFVLATQGWRRFVEQTPPAFTAQRGAPNQDYVSFLVNNGQYMACDPVELREQRKLSQTYWPRYDAAVKSLQAADEALKAANADQTATNRARELAIQADQARAEAQTLAERANAAAEPVGRFHKAGWYGVVGFGLLAVMLGIVCVVRPAVRLPLGISTAGALGLVAFLVIALGMAERSQASVRPSEDTAKAPMNVPAPDSKENRGEWQRAPVADPVPTKAETPAGPHAGLLEKFPAFPQAPAMRTDKKDFRPSSVPSPIIPGIVPMRGSGFGGAPGGGGKLGGRPPGAAGPVGPSDPKSGATPNVAGGMANPSVASGMANDAAVPAIAPARPGDTGWQPNGGLFITPEELARSSDRLHEMFGGRPQRVEGMQGRAVMMKAKNQFDDAYYRAVELARKSIEDRADAVATQMDKTIGKEVTVVTTSQNGVAKSMTVVKLPSADMAAYGRVRDAIPRVPPLVVREFAASRPGADADDESPDTILWQPIIVLPADGKTKLSFNLGAAPGGYQVLIAGHTLDGRIGAVRGFIPVAPPMTSEAGQPTAPGMPVPPKMP